MPPQVHRYLDIYLDADTNHISENKMWKRERGDSIRHFFIE